MNKGMYGAYCLATWLAFVAITRGEESVQDRIARTRDGQGYQAAMELCQQLMADSQLASADRCWTTIELLRTLADHAPRVDRTQRDPLWELADRATRQASERDPRHPLLEHVQAELAVFALVRAKLDWQDAQLTGEDLVHSEHLRASIRVALHLLQECHDGLMRHRADLLQRNSKSATGMSSFERVSLRDQVRYHLALAYRHQALCYPRGSPDHTRSLSRALGLLAPLVSRTAGDPWLERAILERIRCLRLQGESAPMRQQVDQLLRQDVEPATRLSAQAELWQLAATLGDMDELRRLDRDPSIVPMHDVSPENAEFEYARLQGWMVLWQQAQQAMDASAAAQYQQKMSEGLQRLATFDVSYWLRLAEQTVAPVVKSRIEVEDLQFLVRAAEAFGQQRQWLQAAGAYERAAARAATQGDSGRACDLAASAAASFYSCGKYREAADRFSSVADEWPEHPSAAKHHLLSAACLAEVLRSDPSRSAVEQEYALRLEAHLQRFPNSPTCRQAREWLATLREHQLRPEQAIDLYESLLAEQPTAAVIASVVRCSQSLLDETRHVPDRFKVAGERIGATFATVMQRVADDERLWHECQTAILPWAELVIDHAPAGATKIVAALQSRIPLEPATSGDRWAESAHPLLLVAYVRLNRFEEARSLIESVARTPSDSWISTLRRLESDIEKPAAAEIVIGLLDHRPDSLRVASQQVTEDLLMARACAVSGRWQQARDLWEGLVQRSPDRLEYRQRLAEHLSASADQSAQERALTEWRYILNHCGPDCDSWFAAKYGVASLRLRQGNREEAARIVKLTLALYPQLQQTMWDEKFKQLRHQCEP